MPVSERIDAYALEYSSQGANRAFLRLGLIFTKSDANQITGIKTRFIEDIKPLIDREGDIDVDLVSEICKQIKIRMEQCDLEFFNDMCESFSNVIQLCDLDTNVPDFSDDTLTAIAERFLSPK